MSDTVTSVFDMATVTATQSLVPDPGADNHVPLTNGSAITTPGFLAGKAGQEQVFIGTGDQSILVEKTQNTNIGEKRITDVGQDETYTNHKKYDGSVLGEHGHIVGENELQLIVDKNYIKIDKTSIILSVNNGEKTITMDAEGIRLQVGKDKIIVMDATSIVSSVGGNKSVAIGSFEDGNGIYSVVGKDFISIDGDGVISSVGENFTKVHGGGVDTQGKLVRINDPASAL
jgi:PPE-repeat protein